MTEYTEAELRLAALELLSEAPDGRTSTQLIELLTERLAPSGHDAEIAASRGTDTYFDQKVRNITSHRSLVRDGLVTYDGRDLPLVITEQGAAFVEEARRALGATDAEYRRRQWNALLARGGPNGVSPRLLQELGIYRGAHGIWTDAGRTRQYGPEMSPVTVSLLHTGTRFAEDLTSTGVTYHYPRTERPARDGAAIEATKRAARLGTPVFVVTHATDDRLRDVRVASVVTWDDDAEVFDVVFGPGPAKAIPIESARGRFLGAPYRPANEAPQTAPRDPFEVDPNAVDRALGGHARTQNALAAWVREQGHEPMSSVGHFLDYDLAWEDGDTFFVAEIKSLRTANETRQLRLGLGQVLHYRAILEERGRVVRPVLAVEYEPAEGRWLALCLAHGVELVWPDTFDRLLEA